MGVTGINHLTFSTSDVATAREFYVGVLGFDVVAQWPDGAYLVGGDLWLALVRGPAETRSGDYSHAAFHVDRHRFDEVAARLEASGAPRWQDNWTEGDSVYFCDPDGHRLEIHSTTLAQRLESAASEPWAGLSIAEGAVTRARPAPSVPDPRKPRRLACAPVGVFVVVVGDDERILFLREPESGQLQVPNGAMEPGEDPAATALRELHEEAGPQLVVGPMQCHAAFNVDYHPHLPPLLSIGFVCRHLSGAAVAGDDMAGCDAIWLDIDAVEPEALAIPNDVETLRTAAQVLRAGH